MSVVWVTSALTELLISSESVGAFSFRNWRTSAECSLLTWSAAIGGGIGETSISSGLMAASVTLSLSGCWFKERAVTWTSSSCRAGPVTGESVADASVTSEESAGDNSELTVVNSLKRELDWSTSDSSGSSERDSAIWETSLLDSTANGVVILDDISWSCASSLRKAAFLDSTAKSWSNASDSAWYVQNWTRCRWPRCKWTTDGLAPQFLDSPSTHRETQ